MDRTVLEALESSRDLMQRIGISQDSADRANDAIDDINDVVERSVEIQEQIRPLSIVGGSVMDICEEDLEEEFRVLEEEQALGGEGSVLPILDIRRKKVCSAPYLSPARPEASSLSLSFSLRCAGRTAQGRGRAARAAGRQRRGVGREAQCNEPRDICLQRPCARGRGHRSPGASRASASNGSRGRVRPLGGDHACGQSTGTGGGSGRCKGAGGHTGAGRGLGSELFIE